MKITLQTISRTTLLLLIIIMASCVPQKKIRYFQDMAEEQDTVKSDFPNNKIKQYKIQTGDNLFIRVRSVDDQGDIAVGEKGATNYYTEAGIYLNSYSVNEQGIVEFPLIGEVYVKDLTIEEIRDKIQGLVDEYVKNTTVIVKLANFRVTLIGEFHRPGKYLVYQDDITIFQAIALAGDMTDFARRSEIVLVRLTENGSKMYTLDLNDQDILESDYYYMMPNDILYASPLKGKQFAFSQFPYGLIISMITMVLVIAAFFR